MIVEELASRPIHSIGLVNLATSWEYRSRNPVIQFALTSLLIQPWKETCNSLDFELLLFHRLV